MTRIVTTWAMLGFSSGIRLALLFGCLTLTAGAAYYSAPPEELPLVRVTTKSGSLVGELQNEDETTLELFDFKSNRIVSVSKTSVTGIENPITLDEAAGYVGLPAVMGRKIMSCRSVRFRLARLRKSDLRRSISLWQNPAG